MRRATKLAIQQSLSVTLALAFTFDPQTIARATGSVAAESASGGASPARYLWAHVRHGAMSALQALDRFLFRRCYALGPTDLVQSSVPNAFVDATAKGTKLPITGPYSVVTMNIGFTFPYYGQSYTQVAVSAQGYLLLGNASALGAPEGIPAADLSGMGVIAPFWDDLDPSQNMQAQVVFLRQGTSPGQALVIEWSRVPLRTDPSSGLTFEAILFDTGEVQFHYGPLINGDGTVGAGRASGSTAVVGVTAPDGTSGIQTEFQNAGSLAPGRSFAFTVGSAPLKRGDLRGDMNGDGTVDILDQSRVSEIAVRGGQLASAHELLLADVAPQTNQSFGDAAIDIQDGELLSEVIVEHTIPNPVLATVTPEVAAIGSTITLDGSGFSPTLANNAVFFTGGSGAISAGAATVDQAGTELTVVVPAGATLGPIYVAVANVTFQYPAPHSMTLVSNKRRFVPFGAPIIESVSPAAALPGDSVQLRGLNLTSTTAITVGGVPASITFSDLTNTDGRIVFTVPSEVAVGATNVVATSAFGASQGFSFSVADLPVAAISAPAGSQQILGLTPILGTASDPAGSTVSYTLTLQHEVPGADEAVIGSGTSSLTNGQLGMLDPTVLVNGFYTLRLYVTNAFGKAKTAEVDSLQIRGDQKVGVFTISFNDLTIPLSGVNITVVRSYDSRDRSRSMDFGYGWKLSLSNVDTEKDGSGNVILTLPDGKREPFVFNPQPADQFGSFYTIHYDVTPGVYDTLTIPGEQEIINNFGTWFYLTTGDIFDPTQLTLSRPDGTILQITAPPYGITDPTTGLQSITDRSGNTVMFATNGVSSAQAGVAALFTRDGIGRITSITDPTGNSIGYQYDNSGNLVKVTTQAERDTGFDYDSSHFLAKIIDGKGVAAARTSYNAQGRMTSTTDAFGNKISYAYDLGARTTTITDRRGFTRSTTYNALGDIVVQIDQLGDATRYEYDSNRNQTAKIDALGHRWQKTYDSRGNVLTETDPLGDTITRTYDAFGNVLTVRDPRGNVTTNAYVAQGFGLGKLQTVTDALGHVTTFSYDYHGNLGTRTDSLGNTTTFQHDNAGRVVLITPPTGAQTQIVYDKLGNVIAQRQGFFVSEYYFATLRQALTLRDASGLVTGTVDPLGNTTQIHYDENGKRSAIVDALQRKTQFDYDARGSLTTTKFADGTTLGAEYDAEARVSAVIDQANRRTTVVYDAAGRRTEVHLPDGSAAYSTFDAVGDVVTQTNPRGFAIGFAYDAARRKTAVSDAAGNTAAIGYDAFSNVTSYTIANGSPTTITYDALNNPTATALPSGGTISVAYDALGRRTIVTDPNGHPTQYGYDAIGRITSVTDAKGDVTTRVLDPLGNVVEEHDAAGNVTKKGYDSAGNVVSITRPDGSTAMYALDSVGAIATFTDFAGATIGFEHDAVGRLSRKIFSDGRTVGFTYTPTGMRETIVDSVQGTTCLTYDTMDRLQSRLDPDGVSVSYGYDANGNITQITTPAGTASYSYDQRDFLQTVTSVVGELTQYQYDPSGNVVLVVSGGVQTQFGYDEGSRVTSIQTKAGTAVVSSAAYVYDNAGNVVGILEQGRSATCGYDELNRLTGEVVTDSSGVSGYQFGYDACGNRVSEVISGPNLPQETRTYAYDVNSRLTSELRTSSAGNQTIGYTYDPDGNVLTRTASSELRQYSWNSEHRMTNLTITGSGGVALMQFAYDEDGIRVSKTVGGRTTRFVSAHVPHDVDQVIEERDETTNALLALYTYGRGLVSQQRASTTSFLIADAFQNVRDAVNAQGTSDTVTYDPFGNVTSRQGASIINYLFSREQFDPDVSAYYLRARYYSPETGRFLSEDQFGGHQGDPGSRNRYAYGRSNPLRFHDPSGNVELTLGGQINTTALIGALAVALVTPLAALALPRIARGAVVAINGVVYGAETAIDGTADYVEELISKVVKGGKTWTRETIDQLLDDATSIAEVLDAIKAWESTPFHGHHTVPQYFGGHPEQVLAQIPRLVHEVIHVLLDNWGIAKPLRFYGAMPKFLGIARDFGRENGPVLMALATDPGWRGYLGETLFDFYTTFGFFLSEQIYENFNSIELPRYLELRDDLSNIHPSCPWWRTELFSAQAGNGNFPAPPGY